ncbi:glutamate-rich protein 1 [Molossus nigricans]
MRCRELCRARGEERTWVPAGPGRTRARAVPLAGALPSCARGRRASERTRPLGARPAALQDARPGGRRADPPKAPAGGPLSRSSRTARQLGPGAPGLQSLSSERARSQGARRPRPQLSQEPIRSQSAADGHQRQRPWVRTGHACRCGRAYGADTEAALELGRAGVGGRASRMAAARRGVFVEKVLRRLFPHDPRDQGKETSVPAAAETLPENARRGPVPPLPGGSTGTPPGRRPYTATPPPEGYAPAPPEPLGPADSEGSSSSAGAGDQDLCGQPRRRRVRRHRSKRRSEDPDSTHGARAAEGGRQSVSQGSPHPQHTDGATMSKNKKRKLKKKQQMRRRRAAGSLTEASGISFLYEPREGGPEPGDTREDAGDAEGHGDTGDAGQGPGRGSDEKADRILDFFKSTQEMYFYDGVSKDSDPAFLGAAEQLFDDLGTGSLPAADLLALDHMWALLFLQDPGELQRALQVFTGRCTLPPDQARVISAFFSYWITHVLPGKQ